MLVIACCNRSKSARNELYGRFNPYTAFRKRFRPLFHLYTTRPMQHLTWKSKYIGISGCIWEVKCVEILVKECYNRAKSAKNELYGRFNPYVEGLSRFRALVELNISPDNGQISLLKVRKILRFRIFASLVGAKHVEMLVIEYCNRAKSAKNELYGQFHPYTEARKRFRTLFDLNTTRRWQHLTWKSKNIDISGCMW